MRSVKVKLNAPFYLIIKKNIKVRTTGLEPARPKRPPAPQAGVSTNSTTCAIDKLQTKKVKQICLTSLL